VAAYLLFAELISMVQFVGGLLVLSGIALAQWTDGRKAGTV